MGPLETHPLNKWIPKACLWRSLRQSLNLACLAGHTQGQSAWVPVRERPMWLGSGPEGPRTGWMWTKDIVPGRRLSGGDATRPTWRTRNGSGSALPACICRTRRAAESRSARGGERPAHPGPCGLWLAHAAGVFRPWRTLTWRFRRSVRGPWQGCADGCGGLPRPRQRDRTQAAGPDPMPVTRRSDGTRPRDPLRDAFRCPSARLGTVPPRLSVAAC